jgi:hypothetical protein
MKPEQEEEAREHLMMAEKFIALAEKHLGSFIGSPPHKKTKVKEIVEDALFGKERL